MPPSRHNCSALSSIDISAICACRPEHIVSYNCLSKSETFYVLFKPSIIRIANSERLYVLYRFTTILNSASHMTQDASQYFFFDAVDWTGGESTWWNPANVRGDSNLKCSRVCIMSLWPACSPLRRAVIFLMSIPLVLIAMFKCNSTCYNPPPLPRLNLSNLVRTFLSPNQLSRKRFIQVV